MDDLKERFKKMDEDFYKQSVVSLNALDSAQSLITKVNDKLPPKWYWTYYKTTLHLLRAGDEKAKASEFRKVCRMIERHTNKKLTRTSYTLGDGTQLTAYLYSKELVIRIEQNNPKCEMILETISTPATSYVKVTPSKYCLGG